MKLIMEPTGKKPDGRGKSPNSLKNLKPVRPGDPGRNLKGANAHDQQMKEWKKLSQEYVREIINLTLMGNTAKLQEIYADESETPMKRSLAGTVYDAVQMKNFFVIERIAERILGKVPDKVEHTINEIKPLTREELIEQRNKLIEARDSGEA